MENLLLNAWSTVGSIVLAILILLVMVTIHEFGHYIAGKILGFRIDEFSVGFGPALFKRRSKKTGELFALRLIPLGGYCAFAGEDGLDDERDKPQENGAKPPLSEPFADMLPEDEQPSAAPRRGMPPRRRVLRGKPCRKLLYARARNLPRWRRGSASSSWWRAPL